MSRPNYMEEAMTASGIRMALDAAAGRLRTGNPLVKGEMPAEGTPEFTGALLGFVYAHGAPWPDVVRASFDLQTFREAALLFCRVLAPADFQTAFRRLEEQSRELETAQVDPVGGLPGKMAVPATSRAT